MMKYLLELRDDRGNVIRLDNNAEFDTAVVLTVNKKGVVKDYKLTTRGLVHAILDYTNGWQ